MQVGHQSDEGSDLKVFQNRSLDSLDRKGSWTEFLLLLDHLLDRASRDPVRASLIPQQVTPATAPLLPSVRVQE